MCSMRVGVDGWGVISWGCYDPVFEIKFYITISRFEITVFEKEVSRKGVSRFEKSVFEINDFFRLIHIVGKIGPQ